MPTVNDLPAGWTILRSPAPWIEAGPGGKTAEITFMIGLSDLDAFGATAAGTKETVVLSSGTTIERIAPLVHPDDPDLVALSYRAEAFGTPGGSGPSIHSTQFSHYRVAVQFATLPFDQAGDQAYYTLTTDTAESFLSVPNIKTLFSNGTSSTGEYSLPVAVTVINLTTFLSITPVTFALASLVGKVNSVAFDQFPSQTLRFTGVKSDYAQGAITRTLVKSYTLQFRAQHWNKALRADGVWDTLTLGTSGVGPFLTTDLNVLKTM